MSFEDLVQLLILGGAGLAWLLSSGKTKKPPQEPRPRRPAPRLAPRRQPADTMAQEIYRILSGEVEQREREESLEIREGDEGSLEIIREEAAPSRASLEEIHEAEAYSLETLEPAGEESHQRFHKKYATPAQPAQPAASAEPVKRLRLTVNARSLREAMLWREILGPPKGL